MDEPGFYIDSSAMLENRVSLAATGIAMSLVSEVWWPTQRGFQWDAAELAKKISAPDASPEALEQHREEVATYFTILPDGRWIPSPRFFSMSDGNAEAPKT